MGLCTLFLVFGMQLLPSTKNQVLSTKSQILIACSKPEQHGASYIEHFVLLVFCQNQP